jgi:hypothetical protein
MTTVNVTTLKEKLSYYLGLVREGQEVVVTSRRHGLHEFFRRQQWTPLREPSRSVKDLRKLKGTKPRRAVSAVKTLLEDRRRR